MWTQKIPNGELLEKLAKFVTTLDHFPVRDEINIQAKKVPSFPHWVTIRNRHKGMPETAAALLKFSEQTGNTHLAGLCEQRLRQEAPKPKPAEKTRAKQVASLGSRFGNFTRAWCGCSGCSFADRRALWFPSRRTGDVGGRPSPSMGLRRISAGDAVFRADITEVVWNVVNGVPIVRRNCDFTGSSFDGVDGAGTGR
jgi:hypothetical protein